MQNHYSINPSFYVCDMGEDKNTAAMSSDYGMNYRWSCACLPWFLAQWLLHGRVLPLPCPESKGVRVWESELCFGFLTSTKYIGLWTTEFKLFSMQAEFHSWRRRRRRRNCPKVVLSSKNGCLPSDLRTLFYAIPFFLQGLSFYSTHPAPPTPTKSFPWDSVPTMDAGTWMKYPGSFGIPFIEQKPERWRWAWGKPLNVWEWAPPNPRIQAWLLLACSLRTPWQPAIIRGGKAAKTRRTLITLSNRKLESSCKKTV